jgi:hypothetical protein
MFSQSSLSTSSTSESTVLTVEDENSFDNLDVKIFFIAVENPKGLKCSKCSHFWKSINTTAMKAHLSNAKFAIQYKISLCKMVPKTLSGKMVDLLSELNKKSEDKFSFSKRLASDMLFKRDDYAADISSKKASMSIDQCFDMASHKLADEKLSIYMFRGSHLIHAT